jgi:hypothetical protein
MKKGVRQSLIIPVDVSREPNDDPVLPVLPPRDPRPLVPLRDPSELKSLEPPLNEPRELRPLELPPPRELKDDEPLEPNSDPRSERPA